MVVKVRYVRSAPVTNTLAQVREKSSIFPHTHVMFAPVTNALDTLLTYVAVRGYLALHRYIHWVWRRVLRNPRTGPRDRKTVFQSPGPEDRFSRPEPALDPYRGTILSVFNVRILSPVAGAIPVPTVASASVNR